MKNNKHKRKDPVKSNEPKYIAEKEIDYRINLDSYFEKGAETTVEKLKNFTKYVPRQDLTRFLAKYEIFKKVLNIQGSVVECGVYLGGGLMTFAQLSAILEPVNHQRKILGFDTFSGFPSLSKEDGKSGKSVHSKKGGFYIDAYEDLKKSITLYDANRFIGHKPKVFLIKGDIKKTLPKYFKEHSETVVSLLYLDLDLFEPTKIAIDYLIDRMPKGAVIAFDQLNSDIWPGETQAVLETIGIKNLNLQRISFDSAISFAVIE